MSNITLFNHEKFGQVRTITDEHGEPWFVAADIARALGYSNTSDAVQRHCKGVVKHDTYEQGVSSGQALNIIPEKDVYRLIMRSNLPEAEKFQDWVCEDILPSIRKHGVYASADKIEAMLADPETMIRTLSALKAERDAKEKALAANVELQAKITEDAPKVAFAESVNRTVDNLSVRDYAKILYDENIKLGEKRLFHLLRQKKVLDGNNKPYQKYIDNGWFVLKLATYRNSSTDNTIEYTQPRITGKGQIALRSRVIQWLSGEEAI